MLSLPLSILLLALPALPLTSAALIPRQPLSASLRFLDVINTLPIPCRRNGCIGPLITDRFQLSLTEPIDLCGQPAQRVQDLRDAFYSCVDSPEHGCPGDGELRGLAAAVVEGICTDVQVVPATMTTAVESGLLTSTAVPTTTMESVKTTATTTTSESARVSSMVVTSVTASPIQSSTLLEMVTVTEIIEPTGSGMPEAVENNNRNSGSGLSGGAIAGLSVGIVISLLLLLVAFFVFRNRRAGRHEAHSMTLEPTPTARPMMRSAQAGWENLRSGPTTPSIKATPTLGLDTATRSRPASLVDTGLNRRRPDSEAALAMGAAPRFSYQPPTPMQRGEEDQEPVSPVSSLGDGASIMMGRGPARMPSVVSLEDAEYARSAPFEYEDGGGSWSGKASSPLSLAVAEEDRAASLKGAGLQGEGGARGE
ncbi:hypothetical protein EX30DRAFT_248647 [Ascodesmis nigricans]|uniref:Extracellular membrane protein CFEM domain-containing protein n=1 Tax=Ascodesmis nigricans TaxID=341454 RepID=A0A4S2MYA1_9PEZI|nr:hypothetical protein EX30DRAFT_248647 [Ascodesmis nigricans]